VIVLGFDTATPSTVVGLRLADGSTLQARDDPNPTHPGHDRNRIPPAHTTRLLGMADELLARASIGWSALERIAVGLGPGTFTGLRVGVATARGLAQSLEVELVGVSSPRALAAGAQRAEPDDPHGEGVLAVIDARRGEAFAAAYLTTDRGVVEELVPPRALAPEELGGMLAQASGVQAGAHATRWRAVGDGAVRFRDQLEIAGAAVPEDSSRLHLVSAEAICDLGARAPTAAAPSLEAIVPDYRRRPDAEIALESAQALVDTQAREGAEL
jgi:tRNA threonylcarbamoyladenosine biosynthesis protein TsaB